MDAAPDGQNGKPLTRREQLTGNPLQKLPDQEYPHLLEWLFDFGPYELTGSGIIPVTYKEIMAWSDATKIRLVEDEAQILKRLSVDYCGMFNMAKDKDCPPPYVHQSGLEQSEIASIRAKVAMQFKRLKQSAQNA